MALGLARKPQGQGQSDVQSLSLVAARVALLVETHQHIPAKD
jgi:hypothetical protein